MVRNTGALEAHPVFLTNRDVTSMAGAEDNAIHLSFKYRLLPNRKQHAALTSILESQRILYNAGLEARIDFYRKKGRGLSCFDQFKELTELRRDPQYSAININIQRWTLRRLDQAYVDFYRRLSSGKVAGFPRFRTIRRWSAFGLDETLAFRFDGKRVRFKGMPGGLKVHLHRPMPKHDIISAIFKRDAKGWSICLVVSVKAAKKRKGKRKIGIDLGITSLVVLSSGEAIPNPRAGKKSERSMLRHKRAMSRSLLGSKRRDKRARRVARMYRKVVNIRRTYLHQVSARLVKNFDLIAVEDLNIKALANGLVGREVRDASWGVLISMLKYKGEKTGASVVSVDCRHTSAECSACGRLVPKAFRERVHSCGHCGLSIGRDHNAALVILHRAVAGTRQLNAA